MEVYLSIDEVGLEKSRRQVMRLSGSENGRQRAGGSWRSAKRRV